MILKVRMLKKSCTTGSYSQQFIFFVTYKWAQKARVFVVNKTVQPSVKLLVPSVINDKNMNKTLLKKT